MDINDLRTWIKGFDGKIADTCPRGARVCKGGSQTLYQLIRDNVNSAPKGFDMNLLGIYSGLGHTFLRYDDPNGMIYIDPTFSQVNYKYKGILVEKEEELRNNIPKNSAVDIYDYNPTALPPQRLPPLRKELLSLGGKQKTRKQKTRKVSRRRQKTSIVKK